MFIVRMDRSDFLAVDEESFALRIVYDYICELFENIYFCCKRYDFVSLANAFKVAPHVVSKC